MKELKFNKRIVGMSIDPDIYFDHIVEYTIGTVSTEYPYIPIYNILTIDKIPYNEIQINYKLLIFRTLDNLYPDRKKLEDILNNI